VEIAEDGWLSGRFGHPVFTVHGAFDAEELRSHVASAGRASYQAKVPSADVAQLHALCAAGFRVVCTSVTLGRGDGAAPIQPAPDEPAVRPLDAERDTEIPEIAARAFQTSRFHLDPELPGELAARIKRDWAAAYLAGTRGEGALVVEVDGRAAGFLGVVSGSRRRVIDLVAVAPEAQGRGGGRALVRRFCEDARGRCDAVEVGTQTANERTIRFYERLGFETARTAYDLHLHAGAPWPRG
jgi:ribosomal protein S18 acetylase RimI-like enzyme